MTHKDNSLKNNTQLTWTAPTAGTGSVVFRYPAKRTVLIECFYARISIFSYAVVVQNSGGVNTYYATLTSLVIAEVGM